MDQRMVLDVAPVGRILRVGLVSPRAEAQLEARPVRLDRLVEIFARGDAAFVVLQPVFFLP
ncbi:hypothetical protein ACG873_27910 [Mesorhizobium sp. AaZ16]|uniref:hypothetical protein n=1 Tax=Mesorhizobium sp. AaZ16 TaxID=3402289 RepID=UPI00374EB1CD